MLKSLYKATQCDPGSSWASKLNIIPILLIFFCFFSLLMFILHNSSTTQRPAENSKSKSIGTTPKKRKSLIASWYWNKTFSISVVDNHVLFSVFQDDGIFGLNKCLKSLWKGLANPCFNQHNSEEHLSEFLLWICFHKLLLFSDKLIFCSLCLFHAEAILIRLFLSKHVVLFPLPGAHIESFVIFLIVCLYLIFFFLNYYF